MATPTSKAHQPCGPASRPTQTTTTSASSSTRTSKYSTRSERKNARFGATTPRRNRRVRRLPERSRRRSEPSLQDLVRGPVAAPRVICIQVLRVLAGETTQRSLQREACRRTAGERYFPEGGVPIVTLEVEPR